MRILKPVRRRLRLCWRTLGQVRHWTPLCRLVLAGFSLLVLLNILYGYMPISFSLRHRRFEFSKGLAIYSLAVGALFGVYYVGGMWREISNSELDSRDSINIYAYMNACGTLLSYLVQWHMSFTIVGLLNQLTLFQDINSFDVTIWEMMPSILLVFTKTVICPLCMEVTLILHQSHQNSELSWIRTMSTMLPILTASQLNNCFFGFMVISKAIFKEINRILGVTLSEVNWLQTPAEMCLHKPFYRMQRFCDLADRVEELGKKYASCTSQALGYLRFASFSLVVSMAINLFNTTLGCYVQYEAFMDYLMLEKTYDVPRAFTRLVFLAFPYMETVLLARITQQVLDESREAGNLLQRINLEHADIRFKQEVDAFWQEVCTTNLKFRPMGLLELDASLVTKIYSTVAGFLLFLIQNDLTVRFSFK